MPVCFYSVECDLTAILTATRICEHYDVMTVVGSQVGPPIGLGAAIQSLYPLTPVWLLWIVPTEDAPALKSR